MRIRSLAVSGLLAANVAWAAIDHAAPAAASPATAFAAESPFNNRIPARAVVDPNSADMVAGISRNHSMHANLVEFGIPIYQVTADAPRTSVKCTITAWGPCPFGEHQIPIPQDAKPSPGSDGAMVVIDAAAGRSYEFWQAKPGDATWTTSFGAVHPLDGPGWGGFGTGAGASRLGGVIRISEIERGVIPHALALQVDNACTTDFRAPATKTDGSSRRPDCVPQGALIRLDPSVDLAALTLTPAERAVGQALQEYGGYVVDSGGAPLSVSFELDPTASGNSIGSVYENAGLRWDYDDMSGLPLDRLQVLA
ncbi:MAG: hypothetical protein K0U76_08455 [Actinomycetia bacterium]|nr:hypothetical protein [Actinomycetes bacterium]MCH9701408.1 hypothetical protein [Actinomycetes bacterium]MCH9761952.1 hypothetical protein [Actinomycetes bacterium]